MVWDWAFAWEILPQLANAALITIAGFSPSVYGKD